MQRLTESVGQNGKNLRHDVALVQALLTQIQRPSQGNVCALSYLRTIHGTCDQATVEAIRWFQSDQAASRSSSPFGQQPQVNMTSAIQTGTVAPYDPTWRALVAAVPARFSDLRVLSGSRTVYIADPPTKLTANILELNKLTFAKSFPAKIELLMNRIHATYGIAVSVNRPDGDRRTFDRQHHLLTTSPGVTGAGAGESLHCYGYAADLGFKGLQWLQANGAAVVRESSGLEQLDPTKRGVGESKFFWEMLRAEGEDSHVGLFRGPDSDRPHLQNWEDSKIIMAVRFAALLNKAGLMKWSGANTKSGRRYKCDLGYGGTQYDVGSAVEIWEKRAPVTAHQLNQARAHKGAPVAAGGGATPADVTAMQAALRQDFERADADWLSFTP